MLHYLLRSTYRLTIWGLFLGLATLWYLWFSANQIAPIAPVIYTSGIVLLNIVLTYFSFSRNLYVTRFIFLFTYGILVLVGYTIIVLSRGI